MEETLQLRIYGDPSLPTLIYLPGLHGDWTLVGGFLQALAGRVRFVEITYPRTLVWSLDDYAAAIEAALAQNGIKSGWLLGESFGSQPLWVMVERTSSRACSSGASPHQSNFQIEGIILAGGFVRYPLRRALRVAERLTGRRSNTFIIWVMFSFSKFAQFYYRHSPGTLGRIDEFVARRTKLDRRAGQHRLHLLGGYDPRPIARQTQLPLFGLSGLFDPVVLWPLVRRWLQRNCPALRDYKIIARADHNVLATAPQTAANQVLEWLNGFTAPDSITGKTNCPPKV